MNSINFYDAEGRRVAKKTSGTITSEYLRVPHVRPSFGLTWACSGGQLVELDGSGNVLHTNLFANGQLLATYKNDNQTYFHFNDWLGNRRFQTNAAGDNVHTLTCTNYPYGDLLTCTGSGVDATEHHFTGKERDAETGLDYFGARYYGSNMGRFMSPDPKLMTARHLALPQKWNKYAYVQNNPLTSVDPDGLDDFKVFVNFSSKDVATKNTPNWSAIKATAERHGHTVTIYSGDSANAKNYQDALSSKGSHVISVGHSIESSPTTANGVMLGNGQFVGKGADPNNQPMQTPQNVQAASVDIFSCNSITLSGQYAGAGTFVGVDSGGNGTNSTTLEQATAAFLTSATSQSANSPVSLDAATTAAQQTVTNSNNLTPLAPGAPPINIDKGDKVKKEKPE